MCAIRALAAKVSREHYFAFLNSLSRERMWGLFTKCN